MLAEIVERMAEDYADTHRRPSTLHVAIRRDRKDPVHGKSVPFPTTVQLASFDAAMSKTEFVAPLVALALGCIAELVADSPTTIITRCSCFKWLITSDISRSVAVGAQFRRGRRCTLPAHHILLQASCTRPRRPCSRTTCPLLQLEAEKACS